MPDGAAKSWRKSLESWKNPTLIAMLALGVSAGIPFLLIFSTISIWLREAGVERDAVTFFSWAALAYSFKFIWAPLVDAMPPPWLCKRFGRRRGWLLLAQAGVITAICLLASGNPAEGGLKLTLMGIFSVMLGFFSATQDVVIDAWRIESGERSMQALMSSVYVAGYRLGMIVSGAGSLYLAGFFGGGAGGYDFAAWQKTYFVMAALMLIGPSATFCIAEPERASVPGDFKHPPGSYGRLALAVFVAAATFAAVFFFLIPELSAAIQPNGAQTGFFWQAARVVISLMAALLPPLALTRLGFIDRDMLRQTYLLPMSDFFRNHGSQAAIRILLLIGLYRLSDIVMGVVANVFYLDLGFGKTEIADISKTFGLAMTILGGFLGGTLCLRFGLMRILFAGALLSAATNLLFVCLAHAGHSMPLFVAAIALDNLAAGLASAAFVAFLSGLTSRAFTAVQYAIFSSLMGLIPKFVGGYSGGMVMALGYDGFFLLTAAIGLPVLLLVWLNRASGRDSQA
ncbi:MAG: MFS transporter [Desulfobulbaceae bacterium]|jgi:PAT family beta-lactamase induction signal transducer AmpG|nr:MFS transporter [Desulfobulbaceae bacterium]